MPWGIAETASKIEKIKAESSDMLNGLNACGSIDEDAYSQLWDFYHDLLGKAYEQGLKDASAKIVRCKNCKYCGADGYRSGCKYATRIMFENDYCSWAEREEK